MHTQVHNSDDAVAVPDILTSSLLGIEGSAAHRGADASVWLAIDALAAAGL
jgi:hypothetical protein